MGYRIILWTIILLTKYGIMNEEHRYIFTPRTDDQIGISVLDYEEGTPLDTDFGLYLSNMGISISVPYISLYEKDELSVLTTIYIANSFKDLVLPVIQIFLEGEYGVEVLFHKDRLSLNIKEESPHYCSQINKSFQTMESVALVNEPMSGWYSFLLTIFPPSPRYSHNKGFNTCPGARISVYECEAAADIALSGYTRKRRMTQLYRRYSHRRQRYIYYTHIPYGCSVYIAGGYYYVYFHHSSRRNNGKYSLICEEPTRFRVIVKSQPTSTRYNFWYDATGCHAFNMANDSKLTVKSTFKESFAVIRNIRIFSNRITQSNFDDYLIDDGFDTLAYPQGDKICKFLLMTESFDTDYIDRDSSINTQDPNNGVLCTAARYSLISSSAIDIGKSHSMLIYMKFDPIPPPATFKSILRLHQTSLDGLLIKFKHETSGPTFVWEIEYKTQIHSVNTTSPDLAEFFVFGYSMIPKNSSHVYFSLDLFKEGIHSFYLETGSDPFNSVKLKLGKFAGFVGGIYYIDMGILFGNLLHTIYYNFCLSGGAPYTDRKSICLHCGTKGYIHLDGYCATCNTQCADCWADLDACTSCEPGYFPYEDRHACNVTTPIPHMFFLPNQWKHCDSGCVECDAVNTNCTACTIGLHVKTEAAGNTCASDCDYIGGELKLFADSTMTTFSCVDPCPPNHFISGYLCIVCNEGCSGCWSASSSNEDCIDCNVADGYFKVSLPLGFRCSTTCPVNTYPDLTTNICTDCQLICLGGCVGSYNSDCNDCIIDPSVYKLADSDGFSCITYIPRGYFKCAKFCVDCIDLSNCNECQDPISMTINNGICECSVGYVNIFGECLKCHEYCINCFGLSYLECIGCGIEKISYINEEGRVCVNNCEDELHGTFFDHDLELCNNCDVSCNTCFRGSPHNCYSCSQPLLLYQSTCYEECPPATYESGTICILCPEFCTHCVNADNCSACLIDALYYKEMCYELCPQGTYADLANYLCLDCDITCKICEGSMKEDCIECSPFLIFENSICVTECSIGYYFNITLNKCDICYLSCLSCFGESSINCLECNNLLGYFLNLGTCQLILCNEGEFYNYNGIIGECALCHPLCKTCSGLLSSNCRSCFPGKMLTSGACLTCEEVDQKLVTTKDEKRRTIYCSEKCGDGFNMGIKACDDGNIINGDGCDVECKIEEGYLCAGGTLTSPDICRDIIRPTFKLLLVDPLTHRLLAQFDKPVRRNLSTVDFKDAINIEIEGPLNNYSFDFNVTNYLTSQISPFIQNLIANSAANETDSENIFFTQLSINLHLFCSLIGEEYLVFNLANTVEINDVFSNGIVAETYKIKLDQYIYIDQELGSASNRTGSSVQFGSYAAIALSIILQIAFGNALDYMINLLYFLQIICLIPLIQLNLPPFLSHFISGYLTFANLQFDFIPNPFKPFFEMLDHNPVNSDFASNGYESKSILLIYGQQLMYMIVYLALWPFAILLNYLAKGKYSFIRKWKEGYKYSGLIGFFSYSYILCSLVTFISLHQVILQQNWQFYFSTSISMIFLVLVGAFPFMINNILFNNKHHYRKKWFKKRFGTLTEDYNFTKKLKVGNRYWYHLFVLLRKIAHAAIIALLVEQSIIQLVGINFLTILLVIWNYKTIPLKSRSMQMLIILNDLGILIIHCLLFGFIRQGRLEDKKRTIVGISIIGLILLVFVVNIGVLLVSVIHGCILARAKSLKAAKVTPRIRIYLKHRVKIKVKSKKDVKYLNLRYFDIRRKGEE